MKRLFKISIFLVTALILVLLLVPYLFKDKLIGKVKEEINKTVNAQVDFKDADVSLLRSFPSISVGLHELSIDGVGDFAGIPLMKAKEIFLATNWSSVLKSAEGITISNIYVQEPFVNVLVNKKGAANYDIAKPTEDTSSSETSFFGSIQSYEIEDATIIYVDDTAELRAEIIGLNHEGKGNFSAANFDLDSETSIGELTVQQSGVNFFKKAKLDADLILGVDLENNKYSFKENVIHLNGLAVSFLGDIGILKEGFDINLDLDAANNEVASILSLIPNIYTADYSNVKSSGVSSLTGSVKGVYNAAKEIFPALDLKIKLDNGQIQYPDLPIPIKDIFVDMVVQSKRSDLSDLTIKLPTYKFLLDGDQVAGRLNVANVLGDPHIVAATEGKLDLAKLAKAFPFEGIALKSGIVDGNFDIDAKRSDIEAQNYSRIKLSGQAVATDISMDYAEDMPLNVDRLEATFSPKNVDVKINQSSLGRSDFSGSTEIADPLQFIVGDSQPTTTINLSSNTLDLAQLMTLGEASEETTEEAPIDSAPAAVPFADYIVNANYTAGNVVYEDFDIKNLSLNGRYANDNLNIKKAAMDLDKSAMTLSGQLENLMAYTYDDEILTGEIFFNAGHFNSNKYINESEETESITEPVAVPKNIAVDIYPDIKTLIYDNYTLSDIDGKISVANGIAQLSGGTAELFNGKVNFDGAYNSTDITKPLFDLKLDVVRMNFTQYFEKSETFRILVPIAKYIDGIFNSTLAISGPLTKEMMPDLSKISAAGFMETLEGKVNGFAPLESIGNSLGVDEIKNWEIKDSKVRFDVSGGNIVVEPHDYEIKGMMFNVGGKHSIDQNLDYTIKAKIPRELLKEAQVGKTLNMGLSQIEQQAQRNGVNIDLGDFVHLNVIVTGTVTNPKIKISPFGSGGSSVRDIAKAQLNKQKEVLKDTVRQELSKRTEELKDTVRAKVQSEVIEKVEEEKEKVKAIVKEKVSAEIAGALLNDSTKSGVKGKLGDFLGNGAGADSLKLDDWNPFKKKKKEKN